MTLRRTFLGISRYALVVAADGADLDPVVRALRAVGFEGAAVHSLDGAAAALRASTRVALLLVEGSGVPRGEAAGGIRALRKAWPGLPIVWLEAGERPPFAEDAPPTLCVDPSDPDLATVLSNVLRDDAYDAAFVGVLIDAACTIVGRGFATPLLPLKPFLRTNRQSLGDLTAIIPFVSDRARGHLMVSGDDAALGAIHRAVLPRAPAPSTEALADIAAELSNQILGRVGLGLRLAGWRIGLPMVLRGRSVLVWDTLGRPSLVVGLETGSGPIYVEIGTDDHLPRSDRPPAEPSMPLDDLTFL